MPVSKDKAILFARAPEGKAVHQWPVAVFNDTAQAKSYASILRIAYRSGDHDAVKALDPAARKTEDGTPLPDVKWSIVVVPYAPTPDFGEDDTETPAA